MRDEEPTLVDNTRIEMLEASLELAQQENDALKVEVCDLEREKRALTEQVERLSEELAAWRGNHD